MLYFAFHKQNTFHLFSKRNRSEKQFLVTIESFLVKVTSWACQLKISVWLQSKSEVDTIQRMTE